jgi:hypothetical protein
VQISTSEYKIEPIEAEVRRRLGYPHPARVPAGLVAEMAIGITVDLCSWFYPCPLSTRALEGLTAVAGGQRSAPVKPAGWLPTVSVGPTWVSTYLACPERSSRSRLVTDDEMN